MLPITYPSLLPAAQLAFTIWDVQGAGRAVPVGGTTMSLFRNRLDSSKVTALISRTLRRGQQRLYVHRGVEADPRPNTSTPSEMPKSEDEMGRLEQLVKDYERGDIIKVDWLDRIAFRQIERAHAVSVMALTRAESSRPRQASPMIYIYTLISLASTSRWCFRSMRVRFHTHRLPYLILLNLSSILRLYLRIILPLIRLYGAFTILIRGETTLSRSNTASSCVVSVWATRGRT